MGRSGKLKIVQTFKLDRVKLLEQRNRQLEFEVTDNIIRKQKCDQIIKDIREEQKGNIGRIQKLNKRLVR